MRRLTVILTLIATFAFATPEGLAAASSPAAHAAHARAVIPVAVIKRHGAVAVFAKVVVHGRPFLFQVDTGASTTLVNPTIASDLHLTLGRPIKGCGVTGCAIAHEVRLGNWSIGGVELPSVVGISEPVVLGGSPHFGFGLLGSDVLSHFGSVSIDYRHDTMTLG